MDDGTRNIQYTDVGWEKLDQMSIEYLAEKLDERKRKLSGKMLLLCHRILGKLKTNLAEVSDVDNDDALVDDALKRLLEKPTPKRNEANYFKYQYDKDACTKAFYKVLESYEVAYKENGAGDFNKKFSSYFLERYRHVKSEQDNKREDNGFDISSSDNKRYFAFKRLVETVATEDKSFSGLTVNNITDEQFHELMVKTGQDGKSERDLGQYVHRMRNIKGAKSIYATVDTTDGTSTVGDYIGDTRSEYGALEVRMTFSQVAKRVFLAASPVQRKYFACFLINMLINTANENLLDEQAEWFDTKYRDYIENKFAQEKRIRNKIPSEFIAEYLAVQLPAVSKQFCNFMASLRKFSGDIDGMLDAW